MTHASVKAARAAAFPVGFYPVARTSPRHALRKPGKPQIIEVFGSGGYRTLHPTRGWRYVGAARAALYGLKPDTARDIALNGLPA